MPSSAEPVIVIPMAGRSERLRAAGYSQPKYMLRAFGRSLFALSLAGFARYFTTTRFLIIGREGEGVDAFVRAEVLNLGIKHCDLVLLPEDTRGQADTVVQGLEAVGLLDWQPLCVFNIDTIQREFRWPGEAPWSGADGFLDVFRGEGTGWSFVLPDTGDDFRVGATAEKKRISDLCSTGLYGFRHARDLRSALMAWREQTAQSHTLAEEYIAPLYNVLLGWGRDIRYREMPRDALVFAGVPEEYEAFVSNPRPDWLRW